MKREIHIYRTKKGIYSDGVLLVEETSPKTSTTHGEIRYDSLKNFFGISLHLGHKKKISIEIKEIK